MMFFVKWFMKQNFKFSIYSCEVEHQKIKTSKSKCQYCNKTRLLIQKNVYFDFDFFDFTTQHLTTFYPI